MAKTWLDSEIVTLMESEARAYRHQQQLMREPISCREMMESVLAAMADKGLIEYTP